MGFKVNAFGKNTDPPPPVDAVEFQRVKSALESHPWTFAKSMADRPHFWSARNQWFDDDLYKWVYSFIRIYGVIEYYGKWPYRYLYAGNYKYWTMCDEEVDMGLINRQYVPRPAYPEEDYPMKISKDYKLKEGQLSYPVLWHEQIASPDADMFPTNRALEILIGVFGEGKSQRLQTFERAKEDRNGPHWIGLRSGVGLHLDVGFPRYTHQLVVYNDGWGLTGITGKLSYKIPRFAAFCCDTHSPHQVIPDESLGRGLFYLAASMDSEKRLEPYETIHHLMKFVKAKAVEVANVAKS